MLCADKLIAFRGTASTHAVTFCIEPGNLLLIHGPNGSGKTTLLDGLGGFVRCEGVLTWHHQDLLSWNAARRHRHLFSRQFQNASWNIRGEHLLISAASASSSVQRKRLRDLVDPILVNIDLTKSLSDMSLGQARRTTLASSILRDRQILLMDEPLSGIDRSVQPTIIQIIENLLEVQKIIIVVEHVPAKWPATAKHCDMSMERS